MLISLLAAVGVLVVAGSSQRASGFRGFLGELRGGLSGRHTTGRETREAVVAQASEPALVVEPVEAGIDELFSLGQTSDAAYVSVDELQQALVRARDAAARHIPSLSR